MLKSTFEERKAIGTLIKQAQKQKNINDTELAKKIGLSYRSGLHVWKSGSTSIPLKYVQKLSELLDIPIEKFPDAAWQSGEQIKPKPSPSPRSSKPDTSKKEHVLVKTINKLSTLNNDQIEAIYRLICTFEER